MKKYSNEFKVGLIVILAIAGLGYMTFKAGNFRLQSKGYRIYASFDNILGLEKNAPVRLRGVTIGHVSDIEIANASSKVVLTLWIDDKFKIKGAPNIYIRTLGMMGEKYIQIIDQKEASAYLASESMVEAKTPGDFEELMDQAQEVAKNANQLILKAASLTEVLTSTIAANTNNLLLDASSLVRNVNQLIDTNRQSITRTMENLESASGYVDEFSQDVKNHPWKLLFRDKTKSEKQ